MFTIIFAISVFACVAALVGAAATMMRPQESSTAEDRLALLTRADEPGFDPNEESGVLAQPLVDEFGTLEQFFSKFLNLKKFLEQAGSKMPPNQFCIITVGLVALGIFIPVITPVALVLAPFLGAFLGALPLIVVAFKRKRRLAAFGKQLPDALELIARALRAGHSLGAGLNLAGEELAEPLSTEFKRCFEEQNLGIPLEETLENMADRVPNLDLRFFVTAVSLQRQTGGDLAEILDKIGHLVRERFKIYGQVQALTGEGRLSGVVLLALPPVLFCVMYKINAAYTSTLFTDPLGQKMLLVAIVTQLFGALVIRKIVNIKV